MQKVIVVDWSDEGYKRQKRAGKTGPYIIAEIVLPEFKGFCFDGGRLELIGIDETIWIMSHQWKIDVVPLENM